jgi:hypothetical protein
MRKKSSNLDMALNLFIPAAIIMMLTALWWTQELSRNVHTAIFVGFFLAVMAAGTWSDVRREQRKDEIEVAAIRFGHRWSSLPVHLLIMATFVPSFQDLIIDIDRMLETRASTRPPPAVSVFMFGVAISFVLQQAAARLLRTAWLHSKARP